jgi:hypothetical protein
MKDAFIQTERLHSNAIAENRAAGKRARRIDGNDADALALLAVEHRELIDERRLARARRTGDSDHEPRRASVDRSPSSAPRLAPSSIFEIARATAAVRRCSHAH